MFLTTAIDYTNGEPHIGHAYEKVLTDVLARFHRLQGKPVFFLTGVDQHGQKVQQSAEAQGTSPAEFVTSVTQRFADLYQLLQISFDGWAATTDERHIACVQAILQDLHAKGQLYKKTYAGFYSVRQEQFLTDKERNEAGEFGAEWGEVIELEEENWYFKLSEHTDWLKAFLEANPQHITPENRRADVLNALKRNEGADLCISRPKERLHWGIELPFDPEFVCYVWFDALSNYLSFAGYLADQTQAQDLPQFSETWPQQDAQNQALQVIGKDILVPPHGIYWPCMLHALGLPDEQIPALLVHGWWNIRQGDKSEKMSKSLGNVVNPVSLVEEFGLDALRYYLTRDISTGKDSDFDLNRLIVLYNSELANDFGNLANRSLNMLARFAESTLNHEAGDDELCTQLREKVTQTKASCQKFLHQHQPERALQALNQLVSEGNRFVDEKAPWKLAKEVEDQPEVAQELERSLSHLVELVAHLSVLYSPFLPETCQKLQAQLGQASLSELTLEQLKWGILPQGHQAQKPKPLFPRIQAEES